MKEITAKAYLRLKENLEKDDPAEKILTFLMELSINSKKWLVNFKKDCYMNRTSNDSGIIEESNNGQTSYSITNPITALPDKKSIETISIPNTLDEIFTPSNFLYFDNKKIQFLINQDKIDFTYFETSTPYITLNKEYIENFFNEIKDIISKSLFDEMKKYDTIVVHNY